MTETDIKYIIKTTITEMLSDGAILPLCRVETGRIDALEKSMVAAYKILIGGENPEQGLVAKTIRQDGAISANRLAVEEVKKLFDTRATREWGIWAAVIVMIIATVINVSFGK